MAAIQTSGLEKHFGRVRAVKDLDLTVEEGEVYGFLGPNGAGKSTTINLLMGFVLPDAGSASIMGYDLEGENLQIRRHTGALLEDFGFYPGVTARAHVRDVIRTKRSDDDPATLLERVGLADAATRRVGGFSTGMRKRLALAMALVGGPDLLILDEPSTGLDPNGVRTLREVILEENDRGTTIFFSSHILGQVEAVCDRVGILNGGMLVASGSIADLRQELDADTVLRITVDEVPAGVPERIRSLDGVVGVEATANQVEVTCAGGETKYRALSIVHDETDLIDFTTAEPSLEKVFSQYTEGSV